MKLAGLPCKWGRICFLVFLLVATLVLTHYFKNDSNNETHTATNFTTSSLHLKEITVNTEVNQLSLATTSAEAKIDPISLSSQRLARILEECPKHEITALRRIWTMASNKDSTGKALPCNNRMCPMIADPSNLFFYCFIPRVASASIKEVFLKSQNLSASGDGQLDPPLSISPRSLFQQQADDLLHRVSAMHFPEYVMRRYFKFLFVRHPFERLLSSYMSVTQSSPEVQQYYYLKYFSPKITQKHQKGYSYDKIPFKQFVKYLLNTHPVYYDELWQPYWTRCNLCQLHYDFVGKLETANQDLAFILQTMELDQSLAERLSVFLRNRAKLKTINLENTIQFFKNNLDEAEILKLYETYYIDFKLFDYDIEPFIAETNLTALDANVKLDNILF